MPKYPSKSSFHKIKNQIIEYKVFKQKKEKQLLLLSISE